MLKAKCSRTTLYLLNEFENNICKIEISKAKEIQEQVMFIKEHDDEILNTMKCSKREAINILKEVIDWIEEELTTKEND